LTCGELEAGYGWDCSGCLCPGDAASECGDGVCDSWSENPENCSVDCVVIPDAWTCPDSYYTDSWCDCGCGAYDPTCDTDTTSFWDNCGAAGCVDQTSTDCNDAVDCVAVWDACVESLVGTEYYEACGAEDCDGGPGGSCDGNVVPFASDECGLAAQYIFDGVCADPCPTDGGDLAECADDYCPEGTYFDGWSCYDCDYCLNTNDDSACDSPNDCCGACGGSATFDCDDRLADNRNILFASPKAKASAPLYSPSVAVNIATGEITYSDNYEANRAVSYEVTFSCDTCGFDDYGYPNGSPWSNTWISSTNDFLVYGFEEDDEVCVTVVGISDVIGSTVASDAVCAAAGGCTDADADGVCDDVDDCVGEYDDCDVCNGDGSSCACEAGDVNDDDASNVQDIVLIVGYILDGSADFDLACADANGDGAVNVQDIVVIVNMILGGRSTSDATEATLNVANGSVSVKANGFVGAVQMTLSHGSDFTIKLTDKAMIADYRTNGNSTTLIVVAPEGEELFEASGDFTIGEVIVANENSQATIAMPTELTLSKAYPNPFNPSTTFDVYVPAEGAVSLSVYNVMGQLVDVLQSGSMAEGSHSITWNASNMTSGMYFVRAQSASGISVQKVMLMK
jgi:hypothetical protein